jgi:outer membrane receptor protein involved in Fe transport
MGAGTSPDAPYSSWNRWAMNSYFLRVAYTLKDRYSLTATGRYDGSSKFGENNKYAFFPSAGLAWNVSRESWLEDNKTISNLKVHTSYGMTGNSEVSPYSSLGKVGSGTLLINGSRNPYSYISSIANPDLKWEKTGQFDFGVELGLWNQRLTFDVSYYQKKTTDLLLSCPVPHSSGFTSIMKNIGSVKNSGFDIMVNATPVQTEDFNWTATISANYNKNEILKLGENNEDIEMYSWVGGNEAILRVGESMGSF